MAIAPDTYRPMESGVAPDLFLSRRLGTASWLFEQTKGDVTMATPATTCIEEGCTKFRVKNKRCVKHSNEYLARQAELPSPASPAAAGESPVVDAAHGGASMGEQKSLLALVKGKLVEPVAPGFFLDFTGHEDLLGRVLASSEDVNGDILVLLTALLDGKLQSSDDIFGVLCHG